MCRGLWIVALLLLAGCGVLHTIPEPANYHVVCDPSPRDWYCPDLEEAVYQHDRLEALGGRDCKIYELDWEIDEWGERVRIEKEVKNDSTRSGSR